MSVEVPDLMQGNSAQIMEMLVIEQIHCMQGVSRLVDTTAGGDFLDLCDQRSY